MHTTTQHKQQSQTRNSLMSGGLSKKIFLVSMLFVSQFTTGSTANTAISLDTVTNAQIKDNYFYNRSVGVFGTKDLSGTLYSCNSFNICLIGLDFFNASLSNQGNSSAGVDNTWTDLNVGSPFVEARIRTEGGTNSFSYYYTTPASTKSPTSGVGVITSGSSISVGLASTSISDCGTLTKQGTRNEVNIGEPYVTISPNPSNGIFEIELKDNELNLNSELKKIEIFSVHGQKVFEQNLNGKKFRLNILESAGIYYYKVTTDKLIFSSRIVIL